MTLNSFGKITTTTTEYPKDLCPCISYSGPFLSLGIALTAYVRQATICDFYWLRKGKV